MYRIVKDTVAMATVHTLAGYMSAIPTVTIASAVREIANENGYVGRDEMSGV